MPTICQVKNKSKTKNSYYLARLVGELGLEETNEDLNRAGTSLAENLVETVIGPQDEGGISLQAVIRYIRLHGILNGNVDLVPGRFINLNKNRSMHAKTGKTKNYF